MSDDVKRILEGIFTPLFKLTDPAITIRQKVATSDKAMLEQWSPRSTKRLELVQGDTVRV
eukprot:scaffold713_cov131-Cylindrotheca_fusiformis.AAC.35